MNIILPKKVYKFMKPQFYNKIQKDKCIYINHLNNFREDKYGSEIGDDFEGILKAEFAIENYKYNQGEFYNPHLENTLERLNFIKVDNTSTVDISNSTFRTNFNDKNYLVYCVSLDCDETVKEEFGGSTMVIENFPQFIARLNNKMKKKGLEFVTAQAIQYIIDRKIIFTEKDKDFIYNAPFLVKDKRYSYQKEFRIVWKYTDNRIINNPISVYCPKALQYCSF
ncbi:hypothetical protein [Paucisalibacillus globulus]|uniref:hypothetical protein n=1 Tax=Paucisalibacillus globulus TaxID=351095 RepID=UPI000BB91239|nr:hypothetical protein [Paucisalibacillus globulus]